jgi:hypothetical protein
MYIQPYANKNGVKFVALNFSSKNSDTYSSYMADKSNAIIKTSSIVGACLGLISAKNNLKKESLSKIFHNIGFISLALFGILSLNFFLSENNNQKKLRK